MIAYKVVEKGTRFGSIMAMIKQETKDKKWLAEVRKNNRDIFPQYYKGKTIKKVKDSIGIFVFADLYNADSFIYNFNKKDNIIIIKVKIIGKPSYNKRMFRASLNMSNLIRHIKVNASGDTCCAPAGTLFCNAVKVLE